jgi:nicotinate-nucleotide pyrophosphorylase (carboxylating)
VLAGLEALPDLIAVYGADAQAKPLAQDGEAVEARQPIAELSGDPARLLTIERPLLNLLSRLSGVATLTAEYVRAIKGTGAGVYDTRKTTPGLRALEKYAVRCGGGRSHRLGLDDAAMFKDNHLAGVPLEEFAQTVERAARRARDLGASFVTVEVDSLAQLGELLNVESGLVDVALLDNMTIGQLRDAVSRRDNAGSPMRLEASGGVTLEGAREIAESGVERISAGALTHSARPIDFGVDAI